MTDYEDDERIPPCDLAAEAAVLSAILLHPDSAAEVFSVLQPEQFFSDANRQIAVALFELSQQGGPIDILTVRAWLKDRDRLQRVGGPSYLAQILDCVPAVSNVAAYAELVKDKWRTRQLISTCQLFAAQGYGHAGPAQPLCDQAEAAVAAIARSDSSSDVHPLADSVDKAYKRIELAAKGGGGRTGVPTGFTKLDQLTGGWQATDLIVVAARPGKGKTAFGIEQALVAGRFAGSVFGEEAAPGGIASLVFSLEMPEEQLAMRLICMEARADLSSVRQGKIGKDAWTRLTAAAGDLHRVRMLIDDKGGIPVYELRSKVMRTKAALAKKGIRLGLCVIDYLQKLTTRDPLAKTRAEVVGSIARSLKDVARDAEVPIIALAQLNRSSEQGSRRPVLSDLRESGDIEQEADVVAFLYEQDKPETPGQGVSPADVAKKSRLPREVELIVEKQRNGPVGAVTMLWTPACTRFDDMAEERYDEWKDTLPA